MQKLLTLIGIAAMATVATAQSVVIPKGMDTTHAGSTSYIWRRSQFHFQMLYDPSHFLDQGIDYPITITRMRFRAADGMTSSGGQTFATVTAMMSSSSSSWSVPSTTFATNLGTDTTTVFTGNVVCAAATGGSPNDYIIDIPLQTPFAYDPTSGLDLLIDVDAPNAPVPSTNPVMAASSNSGHMARRLSTTTVGAATGSLSYYASVVMLDYTPPPNVALATSYGEGCMHNSVSFYEILGAGSFDLQNSSIMLMPAGSGYAVAPGSSSWFTPTSPDLALGDDALSPAQALGFSFPFPGGNTADIKICSNGFIWLDTTQTAATVMGAAAWLLDEAPRFAPLWYDMNPRVGGSIHFDLNPAGGAAYVTWDRVPMFSNSTVLNTIQLAIFADGSVEYRYQACTSDPGLFGWSTGGGANDPGNIDISVAMPFVTSADTLPLSLAATSRPKLASTLSFEIDQVPANGTLLVLHWGFLNSLPPIDLRPNGMPTCFQYNAADAVLPVTVATPTATWSISVPNDPNLIGGHMFVQAVGDSAGVNALGMLTSNGVDLEFGIN